MDHFHGEFAVVEHVVVRGAEKRAVVDVGFPAVVVFDDVMGLTPTRRGGAGRPNAAAVADGESFALG